MMELTENDMELILGLVEREIIDTEQRLWYTEHKKSSQDYLQSRLEEMQQLKEKISLFWR